MNDGEGCDIIQRYVSDRQPVVPVLQAVVLEVILRRADEGRPRTAQARKSCVPTGARLISRRGQPAWAPLRSHKLSTLE